MEDNYRIQELIESKRFEELTVQERDLVLKEISQSEYEDRNAIILNSILFLKTGVSSVQSDNELKRRAAMLMQLKKQERKGVGAILAFRVPVLVAAAVILAFVLLMPALYPNTNNTKHLALVDTVYKEAKDKIVYVHDTVVSEKEKLRYVKIPVTKYIIKEVEKTDPLNRIVEMNEVPSNGIVPNVNFAKEQLQIQMQSIGKSSAEQDELNKFLVSAR